MTVYLDVGDKLIDKPPPVFFKLSLLLYILISQGLSVMPESGNFVADIGISYLNPFAFGDVQREETRQYPLRSTTVLDTNRSQLNATQKIYLKGGLTYFFNDGFFGIGFNVSSVKAKLEITNSFRSTLSLPEPGQLNRKWDEEGSASATPFSLNAVCRIPIGENANVNLEAGPTLYLCSIRLKGRCGNSISGYDVIYLDMTGSAQKIVFGGNIKCTFDFSMARKVYDDIYFYVGLNYFFPGEITEPWKIKNGEYTNEASAGKKVRRIYEQDFPLENYNWRFKINRLTLIAGIKFHL